MEERRDAFSETALRLYATLPQTRSLGPFLRFSIWVQGCERHCQGCMVPDAWDLYGGYLQKTSELAERIISTPEIEGVTISGGEPFLQAKALSLLAQLIRIKKDLGIIVYTGYAIEELQQLCPEHDEIRIFMNQIDLLIDGPFKEELNDGLSLRGSSNQRIHRLTERYEDVIENYYLKPERSVEIHFLKDILVLSGVPGKEILRDWKKRRI